MVIFTAKDIAQARRITAEAGTVKSIAKVQSLSMLFPDDADGLPERGRHLGPLRQKLGESHDRSQRVVQVVRHAGDQLADGRHLLRLNQLGLEPPSGRLIGDQHDDLGPAGVA